MKYSKWLNDNIEQLRVEELSFEDAMSLVELDDEVPMQLGDFVDGMTTRCGAVSICILRK